MSLNVFFLSLWGHNGRIKTPHEFAKLHQRSYPPLMNWRRALNPTIKIDVQPAARQSEARSDAALLRIHFLLCRLFLIRDCQQVRNEPATCTRAHVSPSRSNRCCCSPRTETRRAQSLYGQWKSYSTITFHTQAMKVPRPTRMQYDTSCARRWSNSNLSPDHWG